MKHSTRGSQKTIPDNIDKYLSPLQKLGLGQAGEYGWHLEFVRREKNHAALAIIKDADESSWDLLQNDGCINTRINLSPRH